MKRMFEVTFVYAFNTRLARKELWNHLQEISGRISHPWLCMGDFDVVLTMDERLGSDHLHLADMAEFWSCLESCGLSDHPATGCHFTWNNKQGDGLRWAKLDRVLANRRWLVSVRVTVSFLLAGVSDHSPSLVHIFDDCGSRKTGFRYMNCWSLSPLFLSRVQDQWRVDFHGAKITKLFLKLKWLEWPLKELHYPSFSGLSKRVIDAKNRLLSCQQQLQSLPLDSLLVR
ncbi:hypothetical protein RND81_08G069000 [Saponaria officinalis]|uniref:Endonuclease/exonuclease/phosphatase domain-containing protein n=1 Tax=Saponaria officinalis TaxID=3572 RepID=A0AAW1J5Z1_SAPOF